MAKNQINKMAWIIETIRKAKKISFEELNRKWVEAEIDDGNTLSKRSFHQWQQLAYKNHKVEIKCERGGRYRYYLENPDVFDDGSMESWIFGNMTVSNSLLQYDQLKSQIQLEYVPSGLRHLTVVLDAMREKHLLEFDYYKYHTEEFHSHVIEPYLLKLFHQRWYVAGREVNQNKRRVYCLDRIHALTTREETFSLPTDFSAEEFFRGCYGVFSADPNVPVEHIRLKFSAFMANYLRDLPLHPSQRLVNHTNEYSVFEYDLRVDPELVNAILAYGPEVEVLGPQSLRAAISEKISAMSRLYAPSDANPQK